MATVAPLAYPSREDAPVARHAITDHQFRLVFIEGHPARLTGVEPIEPGKAHIAIVCLMFSKEKRYDLDLSGKEP